jgi:phospholipid/cholesterol/gamma-HCH transport system substrate-binding protein
MSGPEKRTEIIVGLFMLVGLLFLAGLILQFGRLGDHFRGHYPLSVVYDDASGVIKGSDVRMGGAKIGKVAEHPELNDKLKVQVELRIDERVKIPVGSQFQIESATLLGDKLIVITPPEEISGEFIPAGTRLPGAGPTGLEALQENAVKFTEDAREMIVQAEGALKNLDGAVTDIRGATTGLNELIAKISDRILSEDNLGRVDRSMADLEEAIGSIKEAGVGLAPAVAEARDAIGSIKNAADGAQNTLAKADEKIDALGPAIEEVPGAVRALGQVADKAAGAIDQMESGEGLLGTLAYDREVSTDAKVFIGNLRRYGILRYRDAEMAKENDPRNRYRGRRR